MVIMDRQDYIDKANSLLNYNPTLNNNIGKFNLHHIWDRVLHNTKGLNLKGKLIITTQLN